jgi:hypothetical protein
MSVSHLLGGRCWRGPVGRLGIVNLQIFDVSGTENDLVVYGIVGR